MQWGAPETACSDMWTAIRQLYEIGDKFGEGRDGTLIRKARSHTTGQWVALKVVPSHLEKNRNRALKEARILQELSHTNIVKCFGVFQSVTECVVVLEFCSGGDLLDRVNSHGKFTEAEAMKMFKQILDGLWAVFKAGYAHRDVKLDNILIQVDPISGDETFKIADFGFSEMYCSTETFKHSCGCSTLAYAAPELLVPHSQVNYDGMTADIWSTGVVLYALMAGVLPFRASPDAELIRTIHRGKYHISSSWSESLRSLLAEMLNLQPKFRPVFEAVAKHPWYTAACELSKSSDGSDVSDDILEVDTSGDMAVNSNEPSPPLPRTATESGSNTSSGSTGYSNKAELELPRRKPRSFAVPDKVSLKQRFGYLRRMCMQPFVKLQR